MASFSARTSAIANSQFAAYQTRPTKIASLMNGPMLIDGAAFAASLTAFLAADTAVRSIDVADRWSARNARGVADTDDDREATEAENDVSRSSMKTELPQLVQNDRLGSHRRRHEPQIIARHATR
jgi:hypothetical protein